MPSSFGPTTSTTIVLSIAVSTKDGDSPLVFIQGEENKFIALEMLNRKIRMLWNFGGDTGVVTHRMEIETRDLKYDDAWYQIEANRTMNVGSLSVRRMLPSGELEQSSVITGVSQPAFNRLTFDITNRIWIGGVPDDIRPKDLLNKNGLNVVLHQLYVDQKQIGLWSFAHSEGSCDGAMEGAKESSSTENARHFNGEGYSVVGRSGPVTKPARKYEFAVLMTFKTLDENALLFLAVDEVNVSSKRFFRKTQIY
jgi:laminin, alpha 1/2